MKNIFAILIFFGLCTSSFAEKNNFFDEAKMLFEEEKYEESKFLFQRNIVYNPKNAESYLYLAKIFKTEENQEEEEKNLDTTLLLEPNNEGLGIQDSILRSDGSGRNFLHVKAGGSVKPITKESIEKREQFAYQDGQTVFKTAVKSMADVSAEIMVKNNLSSSDISWLVPHQANKRIIDATARRIGVGNDKVMINIEKYGNTTNGTIPLCLWEWENQLSKGDNIILAAFGGGFTWGSIYMKWAYDSQK